MLGLMSLIIMVLVIRRYVAGWNSGRRWARRNDMIVRETRWLTPWGAFFAAGTFKLPLKLIVELPDGERATVILLIGHPLWGVLHPNEIQRVA